MNEEVRKQIIGDEQAIECRPADLLEPELEKMRDDGHKLGIIHQDEDVITYALYPQVAIKFLRGELKEEVIPTAMAAPSSSGQPLDLPAEFSVDVDGEVFDVKVSSVIGKTIQAEKQQKPKELLKGAIVAPMQGMILAIKVKVGDKVSEGDVVATVEAMKMQNDIHAPHNGVVKEIFVYNGEPVNARDMLMVVQADD